MSAVSNKHSRPLLPLLRRPLPKKPSEIKVGFFHHYLHVCMNPGVVFINRVWKVIRSTGNWFAKRIHSLFRTRVQPKQIPKVPLHQPVKEKVKKEEPKVEGKAGEQAKKKEQPEKVIGYALQAEALKAQIKWMTGSKSGALAMMTNQMALAKLGNRAALIPAQTLLNYNIAPLTGEMYIICSIISGVALDGLYWAFHHSENPSFEFKPQDELNLIYETNIALDRLKAAVLRLLLTKQLEEEYPKIQAHIQKEIIDKLEDSTLTWEDQWKKNMGLIGKPVSEVMLAKAKHPNAMLKRGEIVGVKQQESEDAPEKVKLAMIAEFNPSKNEYKIILANNGWVCWMAPKYIYAWDEKEVLIQDEVLTLDQIKTIEYNMLNNKEKALDILHLFGQVEPIQFNELEKEFIDFPFPVILASTTLESTPVQGMVGRPGERCLSQPAVIGKDIQMVFVDAPHIPKVQKILSQYKVDVLDLKILRQLNV